MWSCFFNIRERYLVVVQGFDEMSIKWHYTYSMHKCISICSIEFSLFVCTVESHYLEFFENWFIDSISQHYLFRITRIFPIEKHQNTSSSTYTTRFDRIYMLILTISLLSKVFQGKLLPSLSLEIRSFNNV